MRILISNLNRQNESDLANKLAALILNNWDESGIPIRQLVENSQAQDGEGLPKNIAQGIDTIEEEEQTKANKIFQDF